VGGVIFLRRGCLVGADRFQATRCFSLRFVSLSQYTKTTEAYLAVKTLPLCTEMPRRGLVGNSALPRSYRSTRPGLRAVLRRS